MRSRRSTCRKWCTSTPLLWRSSVDDLDGARIHRLRDRLLPLVELADQLGVTAAATPADGLMVVVVDIHGKRFGLVVDAVGDTTEVVVEPLTRATRSIAVFAGVTILADGRPTLIVDLSGLAAAAGVVGSGDDRPRAVELSGDRRRRVEPAPRHRGRRGPPRRRARRPSSVSERFPRQLVQRSGDVDVVQYGDAILPLLRLDELLPDGRADRNGSSGAAAEHVQTIVCHSADGPVGLVVDRIDDVVAEPSVPAQPSSRVG